MADEKISLEPILVNANQPSGYWDGLLRQSSRSLDFVNFQDVTKSSRPKGLRCFWLCLPCWPSILSSRADAPGNAAAANPSRNRFRSASAPRNEYAAASAVWGLSQNPPGSPAAGDQTPPAPPDSESGNRTRCHPASRQSMRTTCSRCASPLRSSSLCACPSFMLLTYNRTRSRNCFRAALSRSFACTPA